MPAQLHAINAIDGAYNDDRLTRILQAQIDQMHLHRAEPELPLQIRLQYDWMR